MRAHDCSSVTSTAAPESPSSQPTSSAVSRIELGTGIAPRLIDPRKTTG